MCTLTIIPAARCPGAASQDDAPAGGVRIACNRDEARVRPSAVEPQLRQIGVHQTYMPIDPVGGGTWIAASDAPLAAILMNVYLEPLDFENLPALNRATPPTSRGTIIPRVLSGRDLGGALALARELDLPQFEPFRLVLVDHEQFVELVWAGGRFEVGQPAALREPLFFTSSGLGDDLVSNPRRTLFEQVMTADVDRAAAQDAFHRHVWPDRGPASVWMTRNEARTVSLTVIQLCPHEVQFDYYPRESDESPALDAARFRLPIAEPPRRRVS